jgi:hypothetical protein
VACRPIDEEWHSRSGKPGNYNVAQEVGFENYDILIAFDRTCQYRGSSAVLGFQDRRLLTFRLPKFTGISPQVS